MPECGGTYGNIFRRAADHGPKHSELYGGSDAGGDRQPAAEVGAERQPVE